MSIEALAMAGISYVECGIDLQALEHNWFEQPLPHLLTDQKCVSSEVNKCGAEALQVREEMKAKIRKWVKAVVSLNEIALSNEGRCVHDNETPDNGKHTFKSYKCTNNSKGSK